MLFAAQTHNHLPSACAMVYLQTCVVKQIGHWHKNEKEASLWTAAGSVGDRPGRAGPVSGLAQLGGLCCTLWAAWPFLLQWAVTMAFSQGRTPKVPELVCVE